MRIRRTPDLAHLPDALVPLTTERRWTLWKWEQRKGKPTKPPYQINGRRASHSDPATWSSYLECLRVYQAGGYDGIGYCLLDSNYGAVDLDDCRDQASGVLTPWAKNIVEAANGSYVEVTPS